MWPDVAPVSTVATSFSHNRLSCRFGFVASRNRLNGGDSWLSIARGATARICVESNEANRGRSALRRHNAETRLRALTNPGRVSHLSHLFQLVNSAEDNRGGLAVAKKAHSPGFLPKYYKKAPERRRGGGGAGNRRRAGLAPRPSGRSFPGEGPASKLLPPRAKGLPHFRSQRTIARPPASPRRARGEETAPQRSSPRVFAGRGRVRGGAIGRSVAEMSECRSPLVQEGRGGGRAGRAGLDAAGVVAKGFLAFWRTRRFPLRARAYGMYTPWRSLRPITLAPHPASPRHAGRGALRRRSSPLPACARQALCVCGGEAG